MLNGTVELRVTFLDEDTEAMVTEEMTIEGNEFSWEEGGEKDASFLMIYSDNSGRFRLIASFSTQGNEVFWDPLRVEDATCEVSIIDDQLRVPERFLDYEPDNF